MRDPNAISCDNILNPADPDASYNKRRGIDYLLQVMETFSEDADKDYQAGEATSAVSKVAKPDLVMHIAVGKMTVQDSNALLPAIEDTQARGQGAVQYRVLLRALGLNIHRVAAWRGSFYPQKLSGRLLSALRCHQRVPGLGKPIPRRKSSRFEARTTRVKRWLSPLLSRLFAAPSNFDYTSLRSGRCPSLRSIFCCI